MSCEDYYPEWGAPCEPTHDAPYRIELRRVSDGTQIATIYNGLSGDKVDEYNIYKILLEEDDPMNEVERPKVGDWWKRT